MAIRLLSPDASFVKFNHTPENHCVFGVIDPPLPIVYANDVAFQVILSADTEGEASSLVGANVRFGIVRNISDPAFLLEFSQQATRSRKSATQVLYNWGFGAPGFESVIDVGECFRFRVELNGDTWESNPFKRIAVDDDTCWTSVVQYSSNTGGFGFFDCGVVVDPDQGNGVDPEGNCLPMIVPFTNVPTLSIPITQQMRDLYGELPSFQTWLIDSNGNYYNAGISATLVGGYPPVSAYFDFGGPASGAVRISI